MDKELDTKSFLMGMTLGGLAGGVFALLFAPKSGQQLRKDIGAAYNDLLSQAEDAAEKVGDKTRELAEKAGSKAEDLASKVKK